MPTSGRRTMSFPIPRADSSSRSSVGPRGSTATRGSSSCWPERPTVRDQNARLRICREFERIWIGEEAAVVPLTYNDHTLWRPPG